MSVTIKDIAKRANVSHATVSRALRRHPSISQSTSLRIQKIADEMAYVPNTVARGLKTKRSQILGVVVRRIDDPYFGSVLQGIESIVTAKDYSLFLAVSNRDVDREKEIIRLMSERRVDGVIFCSTQVGSEHEAQLKRFGVPSVLINNQGEEDIAYSVYHDDVSSSKEVTQHLIELGHTRIGFLGHSKSGRITIDRYAGYCEALKENNIPIHKNYFVEAPNGLAEGGAIGAKAFLALSKRPTAIFCYNDVMAIGALQTLRNAGLRIPEDCSITGFDNTPVSKYATPPLTTYDQPRFEIGVEAAKMMLNLLDEKEEKEEEASKIVTLIGNLIIRQSTASIKLNPT